MNGYDPGRWRGRGALPEGAALRHLLGWLGPGARLVAHNARFDRAFLCAALQRAGLAPCWGEPWYCTMAGLQALGYGRADLDTLAQLCGHWPEGRPPGAHRALADARACAAGWAWLRGRLAGRRAAP